jgi:hypothetical protein
MISDKVKAVVNSDGGEYESHEDLKLTIERVRQHALYGEISENLGPEAEQFFLLALSALEQAERYAMLVEYRVRQDRARMQGVSP